MQIVGVIDLLGGQAVHAKGGHRAGYQPVSVVAGTAVNGDAARLVEVYGELGLDACYIADLDAIAGGADNEQAVRGVLSQDVPMWLDAGTSTAAQAQRARERGAARVVIGLETLPSFTALGDIVTAVGSDAVVFSLDLREGCPMTSTAALGALSLEALAQGAADAGACAIIVLDVARVGLGRGLDLPVLERVRRAAPGVTLLAGGGVRDVDDLRLLASVGCDGALVATALHSANAADLVRAGHRAVVHG
jgi:phosphoribosylformimino-5-aminoimidazole carboxamide ribotide isomerase